MINFMVLFPDDEDKVWEEPFFNSGMILLDYHCISQRWSGNQQTWWGEERQVDCLMSRQLAGSVFDDWQRR
jgi:hypothetical protein